MSLFRTLIWLAEIHFSVLIWRIEEFPPRSLALLTVERSGSSGLRSYSSTRTPGFDVATVEDPVVRLVEPERPTLRPLPFREVSCYTRASILAEYAFLTRDRTNLATSSTTTMIQALIIEQLGTAESEFSAVGFTAAAACTDSKGSRWQNIRSALLSGTFLLAYATSSTEVFGYIRRSSYCYADAGSMISRIGIAAWSTFPLAQKLKTKHTSRIFRQK
ncbi:hypothetical protein B0H16DRAFT_1482016 [Mycena metata]|uniref:Uncharacterized protein n=1 Tax=Mycena metata TaxID=1033252 RepID=A0AAD7GUZ1_9AGAR|nr:hypothetical protein B0H16DRAFT_1482016 [Mycena metata]